MTGLSASNAVGWTLFTGTTYLDGGAVYGMLADGSETFAMSYWLVCRRSHPRRLAPTREADRRLPADRRQPC